MTAIGERMERSLNLNFLVGGDGEVYRHMEAVGVIFTVGDALDDAVALTVDAEEASGKSLGRSCNEGEVEAGTL